MMEITPEIDRVLCAALRRSVTVVQVGLPHVVKDIAMPPYHFQNPPLGSGSACQKVKP